MDVVGTAFHVVTIQPIFNLLVVLHSLLFSSFGFAVIVLALLVQIMEVHRSLSKLTACGGSLAQSRGADCS